MAAALCATQRADTLFNEFPPCPLPLLLSPIHTYMMCVEALGGRAGLALSVLIAHLSVCFQKCYSSFTVHIYFCLKVVMFNNMIIRVLLHTVNAKYRTQKM